jgi:hypothetical protein
MPYQEQLEAALGGIGVGLAIIVVIYLVVSGSWFRSATGDRVPESDPKPAPVEPVHEYPEGLAEAHGPLPAIVKFIIAAWVLWAVGYTAVYFTRWG